MFEKRMSTTTSSGVNVFFYALAKAGFGNIQRATVVQRAIAKDRFEKRAILFETFWVGSTLLDVKIKTESGANNACT